jgi:hypothetical protein
MGGCGEALSWFERYLETPGGDRTAARWQYGECLFETAQEERAAGDDREAEVHLSTLIEQGVPRTHLDRAHYLRGEIRLEQEDRDGAEADFEAVLTLNPVRTGSLVRLAEERLREIRYGARR